MDNLDILIQTKNNSIGNNKKEKIIKKTKEITKKTLAVLMLSTITLSTCACSNMQSDYINYREVDVYRQNQSLILEHTMEEKNMEFYQANNTIEEYMQIQDILIEDDIIIYYDKLGEEECNKILIVIGYKDLNDYLIKNGYTDEKGQPSVGVLRRASYQKITEEMSEKTR